MLWEYRTVGRCSPTPKYHTPPLYRMPVFAPNHVVAKSRFWYFVSQLKKSSREIGYCGHTTPKVGAHNVYRECWDLTTAGAVTQRYCDVGARHVACVHSIQITKMEEITAGKSHWHCGGAET